MVCARGREWVVLPESRPELLMLRPLGGTDDEVTGLHTALEAVEPARFPPPDPRRPGDHLSCQLLREAVRLGFRASTGPFRSFAGLAVEPRPYQLVPLLMALKLDPVRLLIADDVGIGKTVEALLVARELLERGEARRLCVLCPPHLAEQWQREMLTKFHLEAALVLPGTAARLERDIPSGRSLFEHYSVTVVSADYVKSDRRRLEFLRTCPELVIVDEAHTCARGQGRHQRHQLLAELAAHPGRHLMLVTATPHSGDDDAFRSLLGLLDAELAGLPAEPTQKQREKLALHLVQRRRANLKDYLDTQTPFPERLEAEETYELIGDYHKLFLEVLDYARELVRDDTGSQLRQRIRYWSALALLRTFSSSPAAAAATLRNRAATLGANPEDVDEVGRRTVLDLSEEEAFAEADFTPGSAIEEEGDPGAAAARKRLNVFAARAEKLRGVKDSKLMTLLPQLQALLDSNFSPLVFCRFVHTAEYLAEELRGRLPGVEVQAVTGLLPPEDREQRVGELAAHRRRVLVCTDCLSEGINLQEWFSAVIHYDLAWNPTRHEQREGRVDRFGQAAREVKVLTWFGRNNPVDGVVLSVLLRKHQRIRKQLGISIPVPRDSNQVNQALVESLLLRAPADRVSKASARRDAEGQMLLDLGLEEQRAELHTQWDRAADREKRSLELYAQRALKVEEVARELGEARASVGSGQDVSRFVVDALRLCQARVETQESGLARFDLSTCARPLQDSVGTVQFVGRFELPVKDEELYLSRTHPIVEGLASHLLDTALDTQGDGGLARRCGVIRTQAVTRVTTLLLLRLRFHLTTSFRGAGEHRALAEEVRLAGFQNAPARAAWRDASEAEALLAARPGGAEVRSGEATLDVEELLAELPLLNDALAELARERARHLLETHRRVRDAAARKGLSYHVEPQLPVDLLGVYLYKPV